MAAIAAELGNPSWCFELAPSSALPLVDLSYSVKSHFLSAESHRVARSLIKRFGPWIVRANIVSNILAAVFGYLPAPFSQLAAVSVLVLGVPGYLAYLSSVRFEIVRLVIREDNAIFLSVVNAITNVFMGVVFGDIRAVAMVANFIGWINVLVVDAQLIGSRLTIRIIALYMFAVLSLDVCIALNRVDVAHGVSVWQYKNGNDVYDVPATDYVVNGLTTFLVLLLKTVYRKRESIRHAQSEEIIECIILQCPVQLVPCESQLAVSGSSKCSSTQHRHLQRLQFVRSERIFDARRIVFPVSMATTRPFSLAFYRAVCALGCAGFGFLITTSYFVNRPSNFAADGSLKPPRGGETTATVAAFGCSASFCLVFLACYQRDLLWMLVSSFDFLFYSAQATVAHLAAAIMYDWERNYCLWLLTCWLWMHWVFCLDALTPLMKTKLRFHVQYGVPVVALVVVGTALLILGILKFGMNPPKGRAIWTGIVFGRVVTVKVLPFFVTRLFIVLTWMLRVLVRLRRASNSDAIILRGSVQYENFLTKASSVDKRLEMTANPNQVHPVSLNAGRC